MNEAAPDDATPPLRTDEPATGESKAGASHDAAVEIGGDVSMAYVEAIRYPFRGPHAWKNVLLVGVGMMIPVVGPMVALGYVYDAMEAQFRQKRSYAPPVDMERLDEYVQRGVVVFVMSLLTTTILFLPGMFVLGIAHVAGAAVAASDPNLAPFGVAIVGLGYLIAFLSFAVLGCLTTPLYVSAGLTQDFAATFDFAWYRNFLAKTWSETLLVNFLLLLLTLVYAGIGYALLCVGAYPALALAVLTSIHLELQLYFLFLARGGRPLRLKEPSEKASMNWAR